VFSTSPASPIPPLRLGGGAKKGFWIRHERGNPPWSPGTLGACCGWGVPPCGVGGAWEKWRGLPNDTASSMVAETAHGAYHGRGWVMAMSRRPRIGGDLYDSYPG